MVMTFLEEDSSIAGEIFCIALFRIGDAVGSDTAHDAGLVSELFLKERPDRV